MCHWLLVTHERVGTDQLALTQVFLAQMRVSSAPVTVALSVF